MNLINALSVFGVATGVDAFSLTSTPPSPPFISTVSPGNVETIQLPSRSYSNEFWRQWRATFPPEHDLHNSFDFGRDPAAALDVINAAFCFCLLQGQLRGFLPAALVAKLQKLPYDPEAPCALVIRGLPLDQHVPPTPTPSVGQEGDFYTKSRQTKCPVAETMLLGISRLMGTLHGPKIPLQAHLVRDQIPTSTTEFVDAFLMHRDYPRQTQEGGVRWEPQFLSMFCVRKGEGDRAASTTVTDSQRLYQHMAGEDRDLLRKFKIQTKVPMGPGGDEAQDLGTAFYALEGSSEDDVLITLFDYGIPNSFVTCPDANGNEELERAVLDAFRRLSNTALEISECVSLQPGDMVIINNARCVHGRTVFRPRLDGNDRWYIKCYVSNGMWRMPGQEAASASGPSTFPDMGFPQ